MGAYIYHRICFFITFVCVYFISKYKTFFNRHDYDLVKIQEVCKAFTEAWLLFHCVWHFKSVETNFRKLIFNVNNWAVTWQNQQSDGAPSEDSDQPGHPPCLIRVFTCAQWVAKNPSFLHADSEDSDQTGRMPRLIWVFAGRTATLLVLSCLGSIIECVRLQIH